MEQLGGCRILAVMGSGETSPTMVTVHRALVARLAVRQPRAVLLDTPYAFQETPPTSPSGPGPTSRTASA